MVPTAGVKVNQFNGHGNSTVKDYITMLVLFTYTDIVADKTKQNKNNKEKVFLGGKIASGWFVYQIEPTETYSNKC